MNNYYNEIKENLIKSEIYDRAKDRNKVKVYFETGKLLSEAGREYGKSIIKSYADKLIIEVGKKYNERTLYAMRKFYEVFVNEIWNTTCSKLNTAWTKLNTACSKLSYREVLIVKDINAIRYYLNECETKNLTIKQLQMIIKNKEYERLDEKTK